MCVYRFYKLIKFKTITKQHIVYRLSFEWNFKFKAISITKCIKEKKLSNGISLNQPQMNEITFLDDNL